MIRAPVVIQVEDYEEFYSLSNRNCSLPTEMTKMSMRELTHASVNSA